MNDSTLMTLAPWSPRIWPARGPASTRDMSSTTSPSNAGLPGIVDVTRLSPMLGNAPISAQPS
ncbi:Uncharacterised protein [Bordetella pertussis]|nr:Uncharacterised protein [Bordetella pertussis]CFP58522.1 Uncharacterised protein [Bordetella pertussis]